MAACPYTVKSFNWYQPNWPDEMAAALNPDVSVRPAGVVEKCTFCVHRLQHAKEQARAENRELQEIDYQPACVESCPTDAISFGDLSNPASQVSELKRSPRAFQLLEELGTEPKVYYLSEIE
jgi:molybdopterin-containing oxidoreductase family iron-sulfur binding subunit